MLLKKFSFNKVADLQQFKKMRSSIFCEIVKSDKDEKFIFNWVTSLKHAPVTMLKRTPLFIVKS